VAGDLYELSPCARAHPARRGRCRRHRARHLGAHGPRRRV